MMPRKATTTSDAPLRADALRNRARVLAAAEEVFGEQGLAVPLDEIARRAGVGAGTVYRHFPTKEALFEAVVERRAAHLIDDAREMATAENPGVAFFEFFQRKVEQASLNKALVDALESDGSRFHSDQGAQGEFWRLVGTMLEQAQQVGAVRADVDLDQIRAIMVGCIAAHRHLSDPEKARQVVSVLCDGLRGA